MEFWRNFHFVRFWTILLSINILNCSIDSPDHLPLNISEDLTYNDMESILEIVMEKVLDCDNFFVEYDENDESESEQFPFLEDIDFYTPFDLYPFQFADVNTSPIKHAGYKETYSSQFHPELVPPPPKG